MNNLSATVERCIFGHLHCLHSMRKSTLDGDSVRVIDKFLTPEIIFFPQASREKLPKHYKTGIIEHVRLIYDLVMEHHKRLESHDAQLQDHLNLLQNHQERLADVERISRNQLIWRIEDYTRKLKEAKAGSLPTLFSPSFTTSKHGYRLAASVCLNGDGKGKGTHMSVFISVLRGKNNCILCT